MNGVVALRTVLIADAALMALVEILENVNTIMLDMLPIYNWL